MIICVQETSAFTSLYCLSTLISGINEEYIVWKRESAVKQNIFLFANIVKIKLSSNYVKLQILSLIRNSILKICEIL